MLSAQVNQSKQKLMNEVYQKTSQSCTATCENIQSGNVVFLDGTTTGDITFQQTCTADASCSMTQSLQSVTDLLVQLKQGNKTEASLFGGGLNVGTVNLNLNDQDIGNQVKQIMETLCSADVTNVQNGNMVYARNSKTGDISFTQTGNAKADCVMQNSASAIANLRAQADQSNATSATIGAFGALILIVIVIAGVLGKMSSKNKEQPSNQNGQDQGQNGQGQNNQNRQNQRSSDVRALATAFRGK